jgi:hypothetical protein
MTRSGSRAALERAALSYRRVVDVMQPGAVREPMTKAALDRIWGRLGTQGAYTDLLMY